MATQMTAAELREALARYVKALERGATDPGSSEFGDGMAAGFELALDFLHGRTNGEYGKSTEQQRAERSERDPMEQLAETVAEIKAERTSN